MLAMSKQSRLISLVPINARFFNDPDLAAEVLDWSPSPFAGEQTSQPQLLIAFCRRATASLRLMLKRE